MNFGCGLGFEGQFLCGDIIVNMAEVGGHDQNFCSLSYFKWH